MQRAGCGSKIISPITTASAPHRFDIVTTKLSRNSYTSAAELLLEGMIFEEMHGSSSCEKKNPPRSGADLGQQYLPFFAPLRLGGENV
jgi:hypothetical protein